MGDIVNCTVKTLTQFGVIVQLADNVDGQIHVSELVDRTIQHPDEVVEVGSVLRAKTLRIDMATKRIGLSCKRAHS